VKRSTVLVTGGGSGIGRAAALGAARAGARVAVLDRDPEAAADTADTALQLGASGAAGLGCDVRDVLAVDAVIGALWSQLGPADGVVTAAGVDFGGATETLAFAAWHDTVDVNLTGTFLVCQSVLKRLVAEGHRASIVCVSSPAAFVGFSEGGTAAYSASKGGVSALMRSLSVEYARRGIRVNAVVPGATETPLMWANVDAAHVAEARDRVADSVPLGRLAQPEEIAEAILWLLSDRAAYVTGSHLVCDGGLLAKGAVPL